MIERRVREAAPLQSRHDRIDVGTVNLPFGERLAGLDQLIAGRDHDDARLAADRRVRAPVRREHRDFRGSEADPGLQQLLVAAGVRAASVNVRSGLGCCIGCELRNAVRNRDLLDWNYAIAACGQHRARHHFDAVLGVAQRERRGAGRLRSGDPKRAAPALVRGEGERDAVHRDAIERGLVECCNDALAQDRPDELGQRQRSRGQRRRVSADQGFGFGR